jgi:MFS superfamily sulfate permease-like transporter
LLITRFDGSLFFANAPDLAEEIRYGVEVSDPPPQVILLDCESITEVDATALITMEELHEELESAGIDLRLARVRSHVLELMHTTNLVEKIGISHIYPSVQDGVDAFLTELHKDVQESDS